MQPNKKVFKISFVVAITCLLIVLYTVSSTPSSFATMQAQSLIKSLIQKQWTIATAESCTGGMIAESLTSVPGASQAFGFGWVSYANEAKTTMLGVKPETLNTHGAVSEETVIAMAEGALTRANAHLAVAVSGIAGPSGGSAEKPVGTVWIAWAIKGEQTQTELVFHPSDREEFRRFITLHILEKTNLLVHSTKL